MYVLDASMSLSLLLLVSKAKKLNREGSQKIEEYPDPELQQVIRAKNRQQQQQLQKTTTTTTTTTATTTTPCDLL